MTIYLGTKKLSAIPMTLGAYNQYRDWDMPEGQDENQEGYLVEYHDGGQPNHVDHKGYISWSPADVFEASYQPLDEMDFGHALVAIKEGMRVARRGWNGKDMWIALSCDGGREVAAENFWSPHAKGHAEKNGGTATVLPSLIMKTASGEILMGWLASQSDMLAEDWCVVETA